jgi:polar amino acid transport system ATP-binding protein
MINELKAEGLNFIIVTHEMGFARRACEKTAYLAPLNEGEGAALLEVGYSKDIFLKPKTVMLQSFLDKILMW